MSNYIVSENKNKFKPLHFFDIDLKNLTIKLREKGKEKICYNAIVQWIRIRLYLKRLMHSLCVTPVKMVL